MLEWVTTQGLYLQQAYERALAGSYTYAILSVFWTLFANLWYYMLLGPAAGVLVARLVTHRSVGRALEGRGMWAAGLAALVGLASPACTFASIPVVGGLLASGFPMVPLIAFLVAAPLMNPSLFVITWGVMGWPMAAARAVSAFLLAMAAAWVAQTLIRRGWVHFTDCVRAPEKVQALRHRCAGAAATGRRVAALVELGGDFLHMSRFVFAYFVPSLLVAAALQVLVPSSAVEALMGGRRLESALVGGLLGIPFYVCGGGAVATVAVLMSLHMGSGAALAFFLTGPATKFSTLFSLFAVMRRQVVVLYLGVTLVGGTLLGAAYGWIAPEYQPHMVYAGEVETSEDLSRYWQSERPPQTWHWNR
ncbi:MAG: permease [Candidatus Latescibacterota bacterium]